MCTSENTSSTLLVERGVGGPQRGACSCRRIADPHPFPATANCSTTTVPGCRSTRSSSSANQDAVVAVAACRWPGPPITGRTLTQTPSTTRPDEASTSTRADALSSKNPIARPNWGE